MKIMEVMKTHLENTNRNKIQKLDKLTKAVDNMYQHPMALLSRDAKPQLDRVYEAIYDFAQVSDESIYFERDILRSVLARMRGFSREYYHKDALYLDNSIKIGLVENQGNSNNQVLFIDFAELLPIPFKNGCHFLAEPMLEMLTFFVYRHREKTQEMIEFYPAGLIFEHHYSKEENINNRNPVNDFNNMEKDSIINAIQYANILSDNPLLYSEFNIAVESDTSKSRIIVMDQAYLKTYIYENY